MAAAIVKLTNDQKVIEHMECLSKDYFKKLFPNSIISIEPKPQQGKQGGHIAKIESAENSATNICIQVIYK